MTISHALDGKDWQVIATLALAVTHSPSNDTRTVANSLCQSTDRKTSSRCDRVSGHKEGYCLTQFQCACVLHLKRRWQIGHLWPD